MAHASILIFFRARRDPHTQLAHKVSFTEFFANWERRNQIIKNEHRDDYSFYSANQPQIYCLFVLVLSITTTSMTELESKKNTMYPSDIIEVKNVLLLGLRF